jgi:hypothetical protein
VSANIKLKWKSMAMENTLAYYDTAKKIFIIQAPIYEKMNNRWRLLV